MSINENDELPATAHGLEYYPGTETHLEADFANKDLKYWKDRATGMEMNYDTYKSITEFTSEWLQANHPDVYKQLNEAYFNEFGYPL